MCLILQFLQLAISNVAVDAIELLVIPALEGPIMKRHKGAPLTHVQRQLTNEFHPAFVSGLKDGAIAQDDIVLHAQDQHAAIRIGKGRRVLRPLVPHLTPIPMPLLPRPLREERLPVKVLPLLGLDEATNGIDFSHRLPRFDLALGSSAVRANLAGSVWVGAEPVRFNTGLGSVVTSGMPQ